MSSITAKTPWAPFMGEVPMHLEYFDGSMFEAVEKIAEKYPEQIAFDFVGSSTSYRKMTEEIRRCARALKAIGVGEGDKVTIAMPNCPQAVYLFYAVNLVGGIANMIHPLSAEKEIELYLSVSESRVAVTLGQFYGKFARVLANTQVETLLIADIRDALSPVMKLGFSVKNLIDPLVKAAKKHTKPQWTPRVPAGGPVLFWKDFIRGGDRGGRLAGRLRRGTERGRSRRHPLFRRHHRHHQGHRAHQQKLQRPGPADHRRQPHL